MTASPPEKTRTVPNAGNEALPLTGIALAILGACLFSTKPIFIKFAYGYPIDATTLMTLRMGFALPFYLVFAFMALRERAVRGERVRLTRKTLLRTSLVGIIGYYAASFLDLKGLTMITAQFERLILFTYPTFVILMSALLFHQTVGRHTVLAVLVTYCGLAVIFGQDLHLFGKDVIEGSLYVLGASLTFAFYILFSQFEIKKLGSRLFTCVAMIAASIAILIHFLATHQLQALVLPMPVYVIALLIAVVATVIPSFLVGAAIERIGPGNTSTLSGIGPVFTTLLGVTLLGEPFTIWHLLGMALVISGALILSQKSIK